MTIKRSIVSFGSVIAVSLAIAIPAFAQTLNVDANVNADIDHGINADVNANAAAGANHSQWQQGGGPNDQGRPTGMPSRIGMRPVVFGTVASVSGNTITVNGRTGFGSSSPATATYSVNAVNAVVVKNNATSTISAIAVGDSVMIQGTVNGTNVTATMIRDGVMRGPKGPHEGTSTPAIMQGNGQPVVGGKVTAVSGSTITITNTSNVTYAIDASNAKILMGNSVSVVSSVSVGDSIIAQGTVNGTSVVATTIIDQTGAVGTNNGNNNQGNRFGFFSSIGNFFKHLFGF